MSTTYLLSPLWPAPLPPLSTQHTVWDRRSYTQRGAPRRTRTHRAGALTSLFDLDIKPSNFSVFISALLLSSAFTLSLFSSLCLSLPHTLNGPLPLCTVFVIYLLLQQSIHPSGYNTIGRQVPLHLTAMEKTELAQESDPFCKASHRHRFKHLPSVFITDVAYCNILSGNVIIT